MNFMAGFAYSFDLKNGPSREKWVMGWMRTSEKRRLLDIQEFLAVL